jgi:hypothetical protein
MAASVDVIRALPVTRGRGGAGPVVGGDMPLYREFCLRMRSAGIAPATASRGPLLRLRFTRHNESRFYP